MPLTFASWKPGRPNVKEHNEDDCALMDCQNHKCDWLDVSCTDDVTDQNFDISFICQKLHKEIKTTTTPTTTKTTTTPITTTTFFPG